MMMRVALLVTCASIATAASVDVVLGNLGLERHLPAFDRAGVRHADAQLFASADLQEIGLPLKARLDFLEAARKVVPVIKQDFIFQLANYTSKRQKGKQLNVVVKVRDIYNNLFLFRFALTYMLTCPLKYRYPQDVNSSTYIEYNQMRAIVLYYAEPTADLPRDIFWEMVNLALTKNLSSHFAIDAVSVQSQLSQICTDGLPYRLAHRFRSSRRYHPFTSLETTVRS
jgi:hypothetical protein